MSIPQVEAVIVGGGFSGISAAKKLHEAGLSFAVLEARERLGGRVYTKRFDDKLYLDFGGQWIGPTQDRMYALCHEYGIGYFETYNEGKNILDLGEKLKTYRGTIPTLDIFSLLNLDWVIRKLEKLARQIDIHKPWNHPKAAQYDQQSLEDFLRRNTKTKACYQVIRIGCETIFACDPDQLSLLHALFYIRSGTSLDCLINIKNGAQQHRIVGGMQSLIEAMAQPFLEKIRFNSPVRAIRYSSGEALIQCDGFSIKAAHVIVAIPPPLLSEIHFSPPLPSEKQRLLANYPMGKAGKCFMVYQEPFWRKSGFSGQALADDKFAFQTLFDCSPKDGKPGILMAFTLGSRADDFFKKTKTDRQAEMQEMVERYFGKEAALPILYEDFTMTDEIWARGCYAALMQKNAWSESQDTYRKSTPPLYFAGTEAAVRWHGYIEGAVLAGEAAAAEILASSQYG